MGTSRATRSAGLRAVAFAFGLVAAATLSWPAVAVEATGADARSSSALPEGIAPSALLTIDQNRKTVVEGVVATWGEALAKTGAGLTKEQLRVLLNGLRSDQLLAASLAGTLDGLRNVIANALAAATPVSPALMHAKALGSATSDLVYTPITPCRIIDSRSSVGGVLQAGQVRNWLGANPGGNFVAQGGSGTDCGIPVKPAAVLINLTLANTTGASNFLSAWPFGVAQPNTAVVNWTAANQQIANAVIIPLCVGACANDFSSFASGQTDLIGDALGYFAAPAGGNINITGGMTSASVSTGNLTVTGSTSTATFGGDMVLSESTSASTGNIMKGGNSFIHNFGNLNTFLGESSGNFAMTGGANTASGRNTLQNNTTGSNNTANGAFALQANTTGNNNTAGGANAMQNNTTGCCNTALGQAAMNSNQTGNANTGIGGSALQNNTSGGNNTAVGQGALLSNTIGSGNTASGQSALNQNTTGISNTAVGQNALQANISSGQNTAVGQNALQASTVGGNTAVGASALSLNTTGGGNTATGVSALQNNTIGNGNTANGAQALQLNTTGNNNTASGGAALGGNSTGSNNTAGGTFALQLNTTGGNNAAFGTNALQNNTTGVNNTASGQAAMQSNTTGCCNTASGQFALHANTTGNSNSGFGGSALQANTVGNGNAAFGQFALVNSTTSSGNTGIGQGSLQSNTTGNNNIALGQSAGGNLTTGNFNIAIGNQGVAADANTIRIGDGNHSRTFVAGIRGTTTGANDALAVVVDSNGQLGTISSSRRFKDDIADMDAASSALMMLRPVTFHYKTDQNPAGRTLQYGLIAEEVADVYPGLVAHSANGQVESVMYQFLPAMLLNEYQKQQRTMAAQAAELRRQTTRIAELEQDHVALQAQAAEIAMLKQQVALMAQLQEQVARLAKAAGQFGPVEVATRAAER